MLCHDRRLYSFGDQKGLIITTKRILVAGGAGFLGSHLINRLISRGDDVLCVDNLITGTKTNFNHLRNHNKFEFLRHDITIPLSVEVDQIYNLACPASPEFYQRDPIQTTKTNVIGAINLLGLATRLKARIFQASTSEIYGDPIEHPQHETYLGNVNTMGPRSCYDEGKRCVETLFYDYHRQHGLDTRIARIFNTYGPHMLPNDGRVISNFIVKALTGDDIVIYGDGSSTRSFCYVDDTIEGLLRLMDEPSSTPNISQPVNIGNTQEYSILFLAEKIVELTGSKSKITFAPSLIDDPHRRQPDITKAKSLLNWVPVVQLDAGLRKTLDYFDSRLASY